MKYQYRTTEDLIKTCAWIDNEATATPVEKARAKQMIKNELKRRFSAVLEFIDDGQNATNPEGSYKYLLNG